MFGPTNPCTFGALKCKTYAILLEQVDLLDAGYRIGAQALQLRLQLLVVGNEVLMIDNLRAPSRALAANPHILKARP